MSGWVKLHRSLLDWEWYDDHNTTRLFVHIVLKANHKPAKWRGNSIDRGQTITSLESLSKETGLTISQIRTSINKLISTGEIASLSQARNRVITVIGYDAWQADDKQTSKLVASSSQGSDNKQECKKNKNEDKEESASPKVDACPYQQIVDIYHEVLPMVPAIAQLTTQRKTKIKNFWNKFKFNLDSWTAYLTYIKTNCTWMTEARPNGNGGMWKAKNLEYFVTEKCYLSVKEDRASDQ